MVKIRLLRAGAKKRPFYRIVAIDERRQRDGRALEFLGTYDPRSEPPGVALKLERVEQWLARGSRPSDTVRSLVERARQAAPAAAAEAS
jgi:small subunit ribosomal protein S16